VSRVIQLETNTALFNKIQAFIIEDVFGLLLNKINKGYLVDELFKKRLFVLIKFTLRFQKNR